MNRNILSKRYELMVHQTVDVKEFRELFYCIMSWAITLLNYSLINHNSYTITLCQNFCTLY
jgi:hypothetical protein